MQAWIPEEYKKEEQKQDNAGYCILQKDTNNFLHENIKPEVKF